MLKEAAVIVGMMIPSLAAAQSSQGLYASAGVGANFAGSLRSSEGMTEITTDAGPVGLLAVGWRFGDGLRAELEGSYRSNSVDSIFTHRTTGLLQPLGDVGGDASNYAALANIIYDIPIRRFGSPLQPYVGGGLGFSRLDFNGVRGAGLATLNLPEDNTFTGPVNVRFGTASAFAYQAIAGASLHLTSLRGVDLTAEYRFFGTDRADVPVTRTATGGVLVNGVVPASRVHNDFRTQDNGLLLGLRYKFGAS